MILVEIAVLALGLLAAIRLLRRLPPPAPRPRRRRVAPAAPSAPDLARLEQIVSISQESAFDVHARLRPLLRQIAVERLATHRVALDGQPEAARALLGEELWELVRPGRPAPEDPRGPGLPLARATGLVATLEDL